MLQDQKTNQKVASLDDLGLKVLSPLEQNHITGGNDEGVTVTVTKEVVVTVSDIAGEEAV